MIIRKEANNIRISLGLFIFFLASSLGLIFTASSLAQEDTSAKIVKYVDVRNNKTVSSATILAKLKTKRGEVLLEKVVNEDVKRLFLMGFFSDVSVKIEEAADGVGVIFVVTEKPSLSAIKFSGNRVYKEKKLSTVVESKLNEFADEKKLQEDARKIEDLYKKAGYPWVKAGYRVDVDTDTNSATAVFTIEEGVLEGGFGSAVAEMLEAPVTSLGLPDEFIAHGKRDVLLGKYGLTARQIADKIKSAI